MMRQIFFVVVCFLSQAKITLAQEAKAPELTQAQTEEAERSSLIEMIEDQIKVSDLKRAVLLLDPRQIKTKTFPRDNWKDEATPGYCLGISALNMNLLMGQFEFRKTSPADADDFGTIYHKLADALFAEPVHIQSAFDKKVYESRNVKPRQRAVISGYEDVADFLKKMNAEWNGASGTAVVFNPVYQVITAAQLADPKGQFPSALGLVPGLWAPSDPTTKADMERTQEMLKDLERGIPAYLVTRQNWLDGRGKALTTPHMAVVVGLLESKTQKFFLILDPNFPGQLRVRELIKSSRGVYVAWPPTKDVIDGQEVQVMSVAETFWIFKNDPAIEGIEATIARAFTPREFKF